MKQFTIFIENKIGALAKVSEAIGKRGINIKAIMGESCNASPYVKLVTNDVKTTQRVLEAGGYNFEVKEILAIEMPDKPGELSKIAKRLARAKINVESLYILSKKDGITEVALILDDIKEARKALKT